MNSYAPDGLPIAGDLGANVTEKAMRLHLEDDVMCHARRKVDSGHSSRVWLQPPLPLYDEVPPPRRQLYVKSAIGIRVRYRLTRHLWY
jgi:hypothetical protein